MRVLPVQENRSSYDLRHNNVSMCAARFSSQSKLVKHNKFFNAIKESFIKYGQRINYTWQHKKAFLEVEKELCGKNSLGGYFHDVDKLLMYVIGIPQKTAHNIHVKCAPHHFRNGNIKKPLMAVIDWECARYTKPDKQLGARDFYEKVYVKERNIRIPVIENLLDKLGL